MSKHLLLSSAFVCALIAGGLAPAGEATVRFTKKPTAKKAGDKVKLASSVEETCEVR